MSTLHELFVLPVASFRFLAYAIATAAVVGVVTSVLSGFLIVRRSAMLGDAVAHGVLPGVALGWMAGRHLGSLWGALIAGVLVALGISWVERVGRVHVDTAMGVVFSFAFALGLAIISVAQPRGVHLTHLLLGNVLAAGPADLALAGGTAVVVLTVVVVGYPWLHAWSFDPDGARAAGVPTRLLHYLFTALLAATVVAALQTVGLVLVVAMLVTPGAAASLLVRRFAPMLAVAGGIGLVSAVGGMYTSYHLDVASGPAIVLLAGVVFALALLLGPRHGLAWRRWRARGRGPLQRTDDGHPDLRPAPAPAGDAVPGLPR